MVLTAGHQKGQRAIGQAESGGREGASVSGAGASGSVHQHTTSPGETVGSRAPQRTDKIKMSMGAPYREMLESETVAAVVLPFEVDGHRFDAVILNNGIEGEYLSYKIAMKDLELFKRNGFSLPVRDLNELILRGLSATQDPESKAPIQKLAKFKDDLEAARSFVSGQLLLDEEGALGAPTDGWGTPQFKSGIKKFTLAEVRSMNFGKGETADDEILGCRIIFVRERRERPGRE
jgi:hypothetical protein